jgi:protein TonB
MPIDGGEAVADNLVAANEEQPKKIRVGGQVAQNNLFRKVQPLYPAAAKAARIQGTVELEAVISKDGVPSELRVVSSPNDDLSASSLEAVRQWRYRPTLLNGNPVNIVTTVIVNYSLSQ